MRHLLKSLLLFFLAATTASVVEATMVYNNTSNNTGSTGVLSGFEMADDVHMVSGGNMNSFQFGIVSNGTTQATVRFYTNNATDTIWPGNGSSLLHTEVVAVSSSAFGLVTVNLGSPVTVPQDLWVSLQFNNTSGSVRLFSPPTIGSSHNDKVLFVAFPPPYDPFGNGRSSMQLSITIPEPSTCVLAVLGLVGLAACIWRQRKL
jgi:hypothetical protein